MQTFSAVTLLTISLRAIEDVVKARQRARQISVLLNFDIQGQTKIATAVSEIARNASQYAVKGRVEYCLSQSAQGAFFSVQISDQGPGIAPDKLAHLLADSVREPAANGSIRGIRRIVDQFKMLSVVGKGTTVWMQMALPKSIQPITQQTIATIANTLARHRPENVSEEVQQQNQELLQALALLNKARDELES